MKWYEYAKKLMKNQGIPQDDLILPLEVKTRGTVSHYLNGRRTPTPEQFATIAAILKISMDELMYGGKELIPETSKATNEPIANYELIMSNEEKNMIEMFRKLTSEQKRTEAEAIQRYVSTNEAVLKEFGNPNNHKKHA